jgi:hypothetical protein
LAEARENLLQVRKRQLPNPNAGLLDVMLRAKSMDAALCSITWIQCQFQVPVRAAAERGRRQMPTNEYLFVARAPLTPDEDAIAAAREEPGSFLLRSLVYRGLFDSAYPVGRDPLVGGSQS